MPTPLHYKSGQDDQSPCAKPMKGTDPCQQIPPSTARPAKTPMTTNSSTPAFNEAGCGCIAMGGENHPQPSDAQAERHETQPLARQAGLEANCADDSPTELADAPPGSTPGGHVIVGAEIRLREGAALLCDSVDMADTRELDAALKVSRKAFEAAREKISKRSQVSAAVLKVMAGIHSDVLKLSVVIEQRYLSQELMDEFEIVSAEITASLRSALTSAGATLAPKIPGGSHSAPTPDAAAPPESLEDVTVTKEAPAQPLLLVAAKPASTSGTSTEPVDPNDMVAKRFREGLLAIKRPGTLVVSLVSNGKADGAGNIKLESGGGSPDPVRRRETQSQQMTGFVHNFNRLGKCEFKNEGTSARISAEFATDDLVAMLLRLASDNPAVTVEYHAYKDSSDSVVGIQITKLLALSAPWAGVTGAFSNLTRAVDALKKLLPKDRKQT